MLMIRFQRIGRRNDAAFRMVVTEKTRGPRAGTYVDLVGTYNPKTKAFSVNGERVNEWVAKGAQVSPSLKNLLITKGVLTGVKVNVLPRKRPIKSEKPEEAASAPHAEEAAPAAEVPVAEPASQETSVSEETASAEVAA
ncbi:MAG: 30S ribosomal protein S16 [Parcubacteria group bacterium 21-54-25]|nr:MAG: 30S ribosomal protein S16 [Parcubacteria group bacterium 21-54-25]HQU08230.1 30S ribosomal protein S16 [Candidatus Paceibacterota bacterium]